MDIDVLRFQVDNDNFAVIMRDVATKLLLMGGDVNSLRKFYPIKI